MNSSDRLVVIARVRPLSNNELSRREESIISVSGSSLAVKPVGIGSPTQLGKKFQLDSVLDEKSSQNDVFLEIEPMLRSSLDGYNTTIFTYGQSGSGKTYSMLGYDLWAMARESLQKLSKGHGMRDNPSFDQSTLTDMTCNPASRGIIPRTMEWLFANTNVLRENNCVVKVFVSYLEIHNERLVDLLTGNDPSFVSPVKVNTSVVGPNFSIAPTSKHTLDIRELNGDIFVAGLTLVEVESVEEVLEILWTGARARSVAATDLNEHSSRSHTIFQAHIELSDPLTSLGIKSKISLVDLAGSEKIKVHRLANVSNDRIRELSSINKSLSSLSNCISALLQKSRAHIPYRDSKLTRILQHSIGGNTRSAFIVTLSPSANCYEETLSTLKFASRAIKVSLHLTPNRSVPVEEQILDASSAELLSCKGEIVELKKMVEFLLNRCGESALSGGTPSISMPIERATKKEEEEEEEKSERIQRRESFERKHREKHSVLLLSSAADPVVSPVKPLRRRDNDRSAEREKGKDRDKEEDRGKDGAEDRGKDMVREKEREEKYMGRERDRETIKEREREGYSSSTSSGHAISNSVVTKQHPQRKSPSPCRVSDQLDLLSSSSSLLYPSTALVSSQTGSPRKQATATSDRPSSRSRSRFQSKSASTQASGSPLDTANYTGRSGILVDRDANMDKDNEVDSEGGVEERLDMQIMPLLQRDSALKGDIGERVGSASCRPRDMDSPPDMASGGEELSAEWLEKYHTWLLSKVKSRSQSHSDKSLSSPSTSSSPSLSNSAAHLRCTPSLTSFKNGHTSSHTNNNNNTNSCRSSLSNGNGNGIGFSNGNGHRNGNDNGGGCLVPTALSSSFAAVYSRSRSRSGMTGGEEERNTAGRLVEYEGDRGGGEGSELVDRMSLMERNVLLQAEELARAKELFIKTNNELQLKLRHATSECEDLRASALKKEEHSRRSSLSPSSVLTCDLSAASQPSRVMLDACWSPHNTHEELGRVGVCSPVHGRGKGTDTDFSRDCSQESVILYELADVERGNRERGTSSKAGYADVIDKMTSHSTSQKLLSDDEREEREQAASTFSYDVYPSLLTIECRRVPQSQSQSHMKTQMKTLTQGRASNSSTPLYIDMDIDAQQSRHLSSCLSSSSSPLSSPLPLSLPAPLPLSVPVRTVQKQKQKRKTLWGEYLDPASGIKYYHNRATKETTWDKPSSNELSELLPLPVDSS